MRRRSSVKATATPTAMTPAVSIPLPSELAKEARRAVASALVVLLALMALGPSAQAQDDEMAMMATHPAVGSWSIDPEVEDPDNTPEFTVLSPDGTVVTVNPESGPSVGSWTASGDQTADLSMLAPAVDPEAGFLGLITIRASITVADYGQTFAGTYTLEFPAGPEGVFPPPGEYGPAEVTGERIKVELMGEPVGPWPLPPPEQTTEE